jgi:hypothetical protein
VLNKEIQGPVAVDPTCFSREMMGDGSLTNNVAEAVFPVPPFVEVTFDVVLFLVPVLEPATIRLNSQLPPAEIVASLRAIVLVAAVVIRLLVPPQTDEVESETSRPMGRTSANATPARAVARLGLLMAKLKLVVFPVRMNVEPNDLLMTGGATTVSVSTP